MELADTDLFSLLRQQPKGCLSEEQARNIFVQLAEGLQHLHESGFMHRDIKPENILLKGDRSFLGDFGFGGTWNKHTTRCTSLGTLFYASPEILMHEEYMGPEADIWSLGVVLYVMLCGRVPFKTKTLEERLKSIQDYELHFPEEVSDTAKELIRLMLSKDPANRPTISDILKSKWVLILKKRCYSLDIKEPTRFKKLRRFIRKRGQRSFENEVPLR